MSGELRLNQASRLIKCFLEMLFPFTDIFLLDYFSRSTGLGPNSKILSAVMYPQPQGKITPPVTIVLSHIKVKAITLRYE